MNLRDIGKDSEILAKIDKKSPIPVDKIVAHRKYKGKEVTENILKLLKEEPILTAADVAKALDEGYACIHGRLSRLENAKKVVRARATYTTDCTKQIVLWALKKNKKLLRETAAKIELSKSELEVDTVFAEAYNKYSGKVEDVEVDTTVLEEEQSIPAETKSQVTEVEEFDNADYFIKVLHPIFLRKVGCSINQIVVELGKDTVDGEGLMKIQSALNFAVCNYLLTYRIVENKEGKRIYVYTLPHKMDRLRNKISELSDSLRDITLEVEGLLPASVESLQEAIEGKATKEDYNIIQRIVKKIFGV